MPNGRKVTNIIIYPNTLETRSVPLETRDAPAIMISLLLKPIYEQEACFSKWSASFWGELFSKWRLFILDKINVLLIIMILFW